MTREDLIARTAHLFWYLDRGKLNSISDAVLVEFIINHGTWQDVADLIQVLGYEKLRRIYDGLDERHKGNYFAPALNLYQRLLAHRASQYS